MIYSYQSRILCQPSRIHRYWYQTTPQMTMFENEIAKTGADVKLVEPENIHITVKFLGDTDENYIDAIEQSIKESVFSIKPFP